MGKTHPQRASGAMIPEKMKAFKGALKEISKALDTLGDLFGYANTDVEAIRKGYFGLDDLLLDLDPEVAKGRQWVLPKEGA